MPVADLDLAQAQAGAWVHNQMTMHRHGPCIMHFAWSMGLIRAVHDIFEVFLTIYSTEAWSTNDFA